jgi:lincosamide nucleotidyltransferase A/C/D/E
MDADRLLQVVGLLEQHGIDVWIDGGWGVDALLGRVTREHDDLDLVAELRHSERIIDLLAALGYELVAGGAPKSFVLVDDVGRQVDVHPVRFGPDGAVYQMDGGREWVYPAEGFSGRGSVTGRPVRCLTPEVQVLVHAGYELGEKDYRELFLLRERFDVDLPAELLDQVKAVGK